MNDQTGEFLARLGERARQEIAPQVDTSRAVLRALESRKTSVAPLGWVAAAACAAAAVALYFSYGIIADLTDPLGTFFQAPGLYF
jgi:type VI protein secretion system component VasF